MHTRHYLRLLALSLFALAAPFISGTASAEHKAPSNPAPTLDEAGNARYHGIGNTSITLHDGYWEGKPFQPGAASRPRAGLLKSLQLQGDMNGDGDPETAVMLWQNNAGSGTRLYLAILARQGDRVINLHTTDIGDRVQIRDGHLEDRGIVLNVIQAGDEDAACCPGEKFRRSWMLVDADGKTQLKEMPAYREGRLSLADIADIGWQLRENGTKKATTKPITLRVKGQDIGGYAGCNRYQASITPGASPGVITIGAILTTRKACDETAMAYEQHYLRQLSTVQRFGFNAGDLLLYVNESKPLTLRKTTDRKSQNAQQQ